MEPLPTLTDPAAQPQATPHADPAPQRKSELGIALFFLLIAGSVALVQALVELRRGESPGALAVFRQKPTSANLRAYEHGLEDASVIGRFLRPWFQLVQFSALRDGGEKVLIGRSGWLFYRPGCDDLLRQSSRSPSSRTNDAVDAVVAWRDELAARGIRLLVVPAPNKESIYPDQLTRRVSPQSRIFAPATADLFRRFKQAGVETVDLFALFASERTNSTTPLYLAQDTHWSPRGVEVAARAVAARLREKGWVSRGTHSYAAMPAPTERIGDLVGMIDLPSSRRSARSDTVHCSRVVDAQGNPYRDDPGSEVLVLGDSFLRIYEQDEPGAAGFIAHLAKELEQPLASIVNDGGASVLVRQELYRRPALLRGKKVVIWEFVERDIRSSTDGWPNIPLPPGF